MNTGVDTMISHATSLAGPLLNPAEDSPASPDWATRALARAGRGVRGVLKALWAQAAQVRVRQNKKRLRVCETVALGDKRFVTIIQVDDKQFLVGGASNSVSLLAQLDKPAEFSSVLQSRIGEVSG